MISNLRACHGVIGNAPARVAVQASSPVLSQRTFQGSGAPGSATLIAGGGIAWAYSGANGPFVAGNSGWVVDAAIFSSGVGYAVGDEVTVGGGTSSQPCKFVVDLVTAAGGIADFYCSQVGNYTAYPMTYIGATGGSGTGAHFYLATQPADMYWDYTNFALYICTTPGTYDVGSGGGSVWKRIGKALTC